MGKGRKSKRMDSGFIRSEVRRLCLENSLGLHEFSPYHMRISGTAVVDFWPTSMKAWMTGTTDKGFPATPEKVIAIALGESSPDD